MFKGDIMEVLFPELSGILFFLSEHHTAPGIFREIFPAKKYFRFNRKGNRKLVCIEGDSSFTEVCYHLVVFPQDRETISTILFYNNN
jgi:hypothetical protein